MEFRTIDGSGNNLVSPELNTPNTAFARIGPPRFADGISALVDGPNPRTVSNLVVGEGDAAIPNSEGLSGMMYAWGQFIDHDLTLGAGDQRTNSLPARIDIAVPAGDPVFPDGTVIPLTRVGITADSGTDAGHPAIAANTVTGWLDGSMVYGQNVTIAAGLRLPDGHMKTSEGDNLPIVNGRFVAGDVRVAENPSLTALQTLFVREHNTQVDRLQAVRPELSGDQLYDQARAIVTAEIAHITYSEFLPHLLGRDTLAAYGGYAPAVDPRITVEFAGAAYRWGHSTVSAETERKNEAGEVTGPALELRDAFFLPPTEFAKDGGAGGFLRHLSTDLAQAMDARIVQDLRNFLFDPPVGLDLAAINIQRGRDLGLTTFNETRAVLGLEPYTDFQQITEDAATAAALWAAFGTIDQVDLWTGGLSENHAPGAFIGPTFTKIITTQFERLRDGDRLWYQNQGFNPGTLGEIENTRLSDVILRNTDTAHIQDDVFVFFERRGNEVEQERPDAPQLVIGSNGRAILMGGPQGDILVAGGGRQTLTGLEGNDRFVFTGPVRATVTDFQPGHDTLEFSQASGQSFSDLDIRGRPGHTMLRIGAYRLDLPGVQSDDLSSSDFIFAGVGDQIIDGNGSNTLDGTAGKDDVFGYGGNDVLNGLTGSDTLSGGNGNDTLDGGLGADSMIGGAGSDTYVVDDIGDVIVETGTGIDTVLSSITHILASDLERLILTGTAAINGTGNDANNTLTGNAAANQLFGLGGVDIMSGGAGNDTLFGGAGGDNLSGGNGDDLLNGDAGDDILLGGDGDDTLVGGAGRDNLTGGLGADSFRFSVAPIAADADRVVDFLHGVDHLEILLSTFVPTTGTLGLAGTTLDASHFTQNSNGNTRNALDGQFTYNNTNPTNGQLFWDADGVGGVGRVLVATFIAVPLMTASDFILV